MRVYLQHCDSSKNMFIVFEFEASHTEAETTSDPCSSVDPVPLLPDNSDEFVVDSV